jgi:tol-pal system protein YbgF
MKTPYFFLLTLCAASTAHAVPVLNDSYDPYGSSYNSRYTPAPAASSVNSSLKELQKEISQLKGRVADQTKVLRELNVRTNALERGTVARPSTSSQSYQQSYPTDYDKSINATSFPPVDDHDSLAEMPAEKSRYTRAYAILRGGDYDQAIAEFQGVINTYPGGEYADNSQYWIGEALLKKGNKQNAMVAFDRVIRMYPRSPKVSDALLKLGMTQYSLGNRAKAKEYYDYLISAYPGTSAANIAYDKKRQAGL